MSEKLTVYRVTRPYLGTNQFCAFKSFAEIESEFDGAEIGDSIAVELQSMTAEQFEALGNFAGW